MTKENQLPKCRHTPSAACLHVPPLHPPPPPPPTSPHLPAPDWAVGASISGERLALLGLMPHLSEPGRSGVLQTSDCRDPPRALTSECVPALIRARLRARRGGLRQHLRRPGGFIYQIRGDEAPLCFCCSASFTSEALWTEDPVDAQHPRECGVLPGSAPKTGISSRQMLSEPLVKLFLDLVEF